MRAPLSWIRDFTPLDGSVAGAAAIADALNQLGLEVEAIEEPGAEIRGVVAARILEVLPHPDADKVRLADVDYGEGQLRVVCGAPNIEAGMVVPFARVGASLPGGFEISRRKIRGIVSEGMLCSARELGLGDGHDGILALDAAAELGRDVRDVLGLDDTIFDLSITTNRPDAMSVIGVARELAAHFGLPFEVPEAPAPARTAPHDADGITAVVEATERCPRLVLRAARITMGPSPEWLQRRLVLAGMRPISNVVDVTNYVMLERCRPLHAFDLGRLAGRGLVVRLAAEGERMTTLDGVERALTSNELLICDGERRPQAIAGIMGGRHSEVHDGTGEILLESAYFSPGGISRSSKRLGLRSEASARFERGVDPNGCGTGADRAIELLVEVAAAAPSDTAIDVYPVPVERPRVTVRTARVNAILGTELDTPTVRQLLAPLGIEVEPGPAPDTTVARCPTWRPDLEREIDLVEEVARRHGLDKIARTVASAPPGSVGRLTPRQRERRLVADVLVGAGYAEAVTMPLVAPADVVAVGTPPERAVRVANPLRAEESVLRVSLRPGLLAAVARNTARGNPDLALFEMGAVFLAPQPGTLLPTERTTVAGLRAGQLRVPPRPDARPVEVADAVDAVHAIAGSLGLCSVRIVPDPTLPGLHPARGARVVVDGAPAGVVGEYDPHVLRPLGIGGTVVGFELDLDSLRAAARSAAIFRPVSTFPPANIDLAFVVSTDVVAADVADTLRAAGGELLESVRVFDVYRSDELGPDRVSLAFTLRFRAPDRTLTDAEIAELRAACIAAAERDHGAGLR